MNKLKTITTICIFIFLFVASGKVAAQSINKSVLIIRVYEHTTDNKDFNKIVVTENESKLEETKLLPAGPKYFDSNQIELTKIILKYVNKGYHNTTSSCFTNGPSNITTYIYEKDNK